MDFPTQDISTITQIFNAISSAALLTDAQQPDLPIIWVNPAFERLTGYTASDIIGRNSRFLQGDDREQEGLVVIRHAIANGLACQVVLRNYRADGTLFWNELRISPIHNKGGDITHYVGIQEDVSDRYTLIRDLQEMSMLRSSLFEQTNDAVFLLDLEGNHVHVNQRACELFGYTHDELVVLSYRDLVVPDEHSQTANTLEKLLAGETFVPYERNFRKIDGTHFPAEINVQVVYNAYNDPVYIQSVLRDITERKRKEKQRLAIQLERERVRLLSTFIETAAHEFRTPLSIISTSNFILQKHTENERLHPHNEKIAHQVSRLSRLVDQLILMSKLESHTEITKDVVNITNLLIMIYQATQNDWQVSRNLIMQIDDNLPTIQAHTAYIQEAVKHLLKNAYMATEHGGSIILRANNSGSHIVIHVEDDGMGIEQVNMGKIFTTFWRNDSAHTTPGFGIGLTIVKRIASLHDGDITAISKAGEGSRFTLTIAHET